MKKGFTLVELLVVMVVLVALMAIVFRLTGIGGDMSARNTTVHRLQRLENCLSGYFAAYGSYPPVALYATHNVYQHADEYGEQEDYEDSDLSLQNVLAVCKAQPVASRFPFEKEKKTLIEKVSTIMRNRANSSDSKFKDYAKLRDKLSQGFTGIDKVNQVGGWQTESEWKEVKVFKFGLMSYLLPRYLTMTAGVDKNMLEQCLQWTSSNELASHPNTGVAFNSWKDELDDKRLVRRIPSQAVCARWMPNLEKTVSCTPPADSKDGSSYMLFGVNIRDGSAADTLSPDNMGIEVYEGTPNYVLDAMTVTDGWGNEFYYYSPAPYQSYRLWSAGPNGATFPPWIPLTSLKDADRRTAGNWMADDIIHQSN